MTTHTVTRSLPMLLLLMAVSVLMILAGATTAGFVFGLVVVGIAGVLLGSMFLREGYSEGNRDQLRPRRAHRGPYARGL